MRILHVNTSDLGGGAERVADLLCRHAREAGHEARLAVGRRLGPGRDVVEIPSSRAGGPWRRLWLAGGAAGRLRRGVADPLRVIERLTGREDFRHPGSRALTGLVAPPPDVVHLHNLHGGYFDLRTLPRLGRARPTVATLHDPWMLTGHCAHPFECSRWETGCGRCPDLTTYPAIRRDATAANWRRKRSIYAGSRLQVATPSRWLMDMVERSMLAPALAEARVIPHGVDLAVFRPADRGAARAAAGVPPDARLVLFAANGLRRSPFRDFATLAAAVELLGSRRSSPMPVFVALGEPPPADAAMRATIRFVPFLSDPRDVATHIAAADVFVHATRADTFPNVVLEAAACGTPVVASAVGGIPEQIEPGSSGELVSPGDPRALADAVAGLLDDDARRLAMGRAAADLARRRFDSRRMAADYLGWYAELVSRP